MFKPEQVGKRTRYTYAKINEVIKMPHLLDIQRKSYEWFLESGLQNIFNDISPIKDNSGNLVLSFEGFSLGEPKYDINECKNRDATYAAPLRVNIRLVNNEWILSIRSLFRPTDTVSYGIIILLRSLKIRRRATHLLPK